MFCWCEFGKIVDTILLPTTDILLLWGQKIEIVGVQEILSGIWLPWSLAALAGWSGAYAPQLPSWSVHNTAPST